MCLNFKSFSGIDLTLGLLQLQSLWNGCASYSPLIGLTSGSYKCPLGPTLVNL